MRERLKELSHKLFDASQESQIVQFKGRHLMKVGGDSLLAIAWLPHEY